MQSVQFSGSVAFQEPSTDGAPGIWDLNDAVRFQAIGRWPTIPATVPDWLLRGPDGRLPVDQADFVRGRGWFNGQPYPNLHAYLLAASSSFSRGSDATYFDANGIMRTAGPNVLRLTHDPVTGEPLGYLTEGATTNLWRIDPKFLSLYTADVVERDIPLRQFTGDGVTASNWHDGGGRFADNVIPTASIYARRGTARYLMLGFTGTTTGLAYNAAFDFDAGEFSHIGAAIEAFAIDLGDGLWRLWIRLKQVQTIPVLRGLAVRPSDGSLNQLYILQPGETVIWGAPQVEVGYFPTSHVATTGGVTITRLADSLTFARAGTPSGTVVIEARTSPGIDGNQTLWCWDDGTIDNRLWLGRDGGRALRWIVTVGGVDVIDLDLGVVADNTDLTVAASWGDNNAASLDGAAAVVDSAYSGPMPIVTTQRIGAAFDGAAWFGTAARASDFDKSYSPAQLTEMSNV